MPKSAKPVPCVIIIGLNSLQGLQAARIFAARGIPVLAMTDDPGHFCCRTNVCREIIVAETRGAGFIDALERRAADFVEPPVLVPCQDESVLQLSRHRQRLAANYRFLLPPPETVEWLMDKARFYRKAAALGGGVPLTMPVHDQHDLERAVETIPFPCVVKPPARSATWSAKTLCKAFKVDSAKELRQLYDHCRDWCAALVVQEWIPGSDAALFSCNVYFNADGEPLVTFVARKLRQWPPQVGESSLGQECQNDEILTETLRLFKKVGFQGLGYLEFKQDQRSGRYVIMEANIGRPTGRSTIAEAGGVELLQTMYCDLTGQPLPSARQQQYTGVKWIHLTRDCASALHYWRSGALTLPAWWRSLRGRKAYAVFSWRDPAPFVGDLARAFRLLLSPGERRRRSGRETIKASEEVENIAALPLPAIRKDRARKRLKIVVASPICPDALAQLQTSHTVICAWGLSPKDLQGCVTDCEILVFRSGVAISSGLMARAAQLQLLIRAGSGLDNLDMDHVRERGMELVRIPTPGARAVAELTFGVMIMLARQILPADSGLRKGHWLKNSLTGHLLKDKTIGIVGAGNIGAMVGEMAAQWGMQAIGCVARPDASAAERLRRRNIRLAPFHEVLSQADFLTLHVPLDQKTNRLIGREELNRMKPGAYVINTARGGVVDEAALALALTRPGGLAGAALDVHEQEKEGALSPLAGLTNVVLTPHIGATTVDSQRQIGQEIIAAIEAYDRRMRRQAGQSTRRRGNEQQISTA